MKYFVVIACLAVAVSVAKPVDENEPAVPEPVAVVDPASPPAAVPADPAIANFRSCLKRAADLLPREANADMLTAEQVTAVSDAFRRAECPAVPNQQEDADMSMSMRSFNSTCKACDTAAIDAQVTAGNLSPATNLVAQCALNADAGCCACMMKYVAGNYWSALLSFIPTLSPTFPPTSAP